MRGDNVIRYSAVLLALFGLFALFGVTCKPAKADCYECIVPVWAADAKAPARAADGDIIACKPCGSPWGKKELDVKKFKLVRIDAKPEEVHALTAPVTDADGNTIKKRRFKAVKVDDKVVIGDSVSSMAVTASEAKAIVEADLKTKSLTPWEPEK
jgi:hypothetical protein